MKVNFVKVKETSAKTSKSRAASIRKGKVNKGLVFVKKTKSDYNQKRVHWYKLKITKNQKVTLNVDARKMSDAGSTGKLAVTFYGARGQKLTDYVYGGSSKELSYYTIGLSGNRLKRGTYYIKVESKDCGNGYYTIKWK